MGEIKRLWLLLCCLLFCSVSFAQVSVNPVYTSERFKPSDKFHAGCENQLDVVFQLDKLKINWLNAVFQYDWENIDILKIVANWEKENNLSYTVEKDKIIFSKLKTEWAWLDSVVFSLIFKVRKDLEESEFSFWKWSYVVDSRWNMIDLEWNYKFQFVEVPECDPDIVAPSVELLFPSDNSWEFVALDTYYQFDIDDQGKWVNNDSIKFTIDGLEYGINSVDHEWNGKKLTIYPDIWMPFNTWFSVEISVSDKQSYGKSNTTTKTYEFKTSSELKLLNDVNPVEFRKIVNMGKYLKWTEEECNILSYAYSKYNWENSDAFKSINDKIWCWELSFQENVWNDDVVDVKNNNVKFSVFAMLGRVLFWSLLLSVIFGWLWKK